MLPPIPSLMDSRCNSIHWSGASSSTFSVRRGSGRPGRGGREGGRHFTPARAQHAAKLISIGQASALRAVTTVRCLRFAGTVVVALAISLMLLAAPAFAQIKWTLPSAYPADNFHSQNLDAFAKDLAEATGGKLSIKVYPNASLLPVSVIKRTWLVHGAKASDREMRLCGTRLSRVPPTGTPLLSFCDIACSFC